MVYDRPLVIDSSLCVGWGGLGEVGVDAREVLDGGFGPVHVHGLSPNILRTSSTDFTRPAELSASPASIAYRTQICSIRSSQVQASES